MYWRNHCEKFVHIGKYGYQLQIFNWLFFSIYIKIFIVSKHKKKYHILVTSASDDGTFVKKHTWLVVEVEDAVV